MVAEYKLEWFRTLNALQPGERLEPGRRVKIVTE
jgi:predicted Zn-dependent protease